MTRRDRYVETLAFGSPDKIPLSPGHPRQSTLAEWIKQGFPEGCDPMDAVLDTIGVDPDAALKMNFIDVSFKMVPEFDVRILEHKNGHYIISDWMGAVTEISDIYDESYLRAAKDFVTRKWHKFPVETREDWEEMKARFDPDDPKRKGIDLAEKAKLSKEEDIILSLYFNGVFWQLREWCGFENLCILMIEDPEFVHEMTKFWGDFVLSVLKNTLKIAVPDRVFISEDMAFKAHSMISPDMTREFIIPEYKKWVPEIRKSGCRIIELDSDGYIDDLIPLWIGSGINCCSPIEVAAHCDILKYRKLYGKDMAYVQGIDKRIMAKGGSELTDHVMSIVPEMYKTGGYIPGCDHGVPPDISWKNYIEFTRLLAKLSGWL